jgi:hypothetical protein
MKTWIFITGIFLFFTVNLGGADDSLEYSYSIVGMEFYGDHDIIKIKVPPWLKTSELIPQIKRVLFWPGGPPPTKKTYIYVFKETDQTGNSSHTGAIYIPGTGFIWELSDWEPAKIPEGNPTSKDFEVYYEFVDQIVQTGLSFGNTNVKEKVAAEYNLTLTELDSIYSFVKYWISNKKELLPDSLQQE